MDISNFDDVGRFHAKFGLPEVTFHDVYPRHPDPELLMFRMKFMLEELLEFFDGVGAKLTRNPDTDQLQIEYDHLTTLPDHAKMFDALIDLCYVAFGTAHILGYPWQAGWDLVQTANMAKERATSETASERGGIWDVVKPEGWKPPDIAGLLERHGWMPSVLGADA